MKNKKDFKFKSAFAFNLVEVSNENIDKYISKAGLEKLKPLMPVNVNLEKNKDLIGAVLNAAIAGRSNLNGDAITNKTAISIAKHFVNKFVDIQHKRDNIKGVIVNYGFSKFGTNELLTEEEALKLEEPFNISLAILLWTEALDDDFIQLLEKSVDKTSDKYNSISASWELLFNQYDIGVGTKNINESKVLTSEAEKKDFEELLQANGGKGQKDGQVIYRIIKGDKDDEFLLPAGIGLVSVPAADVKGLELISNSDSETVDNKEDKKGKADINLEIALNYDEKSVLSLSNLMKETALKVIKDQQKEGGLLSMSKEKISQAKIESVTANNDNTIKNKIMDKFTKISDITDENIKECKASAIVDFISEELKKADTKWKEQEDLAKNAQAEKVKVEANLTKIQEDLKKLQDVAAQKEAEETFNQRMTYFDDTYELNKEERQAIAAEVKDADKDTFEKAKSKYDIFLKDKSKASIKEKQDLEEAEAKKSGKVFDKETKKWVNKEDLKDSKESKASLENKEVIDNALENGTKVNKEIPNAAGTEKTLADKYAEAFKPENCIELGK